MVQTAACRQQCIQILHLSTRYYALIISGLTSKSVECRQNSKLKIVGGVMHKFVCTRLHLLALVCTHLLHYMAICAAAASAQRSPSTAALTMPPA